MKIAIIDTGVFPHKDFREKLLYGKNFTYEGNSQNVSDNVGHGTHITGIIHNIVPEADLFIIKVLDKNGTGDSYDIIEGIYYAIEKGADIINLSLSCPGDFEEEVDALECVVYEALDSNIPIICAAGNISDTIEYPAAFSSKIQNIISVGSLDPDGNISDFSPKDCDIYAIGEDVKSTFPNDSYEYMTGTSMSAAKITAYLAKELIEKRDIQEFIKNNKYIKR